MYLRPLFSQPFCVSGHKSLRSLNVALRNVADDFCDTARREINSYDGANLRDMHMHARS